MPQLHLARFKVDATVPIGHPLCGGWIKPAQAVTEPLYAIGLVLLGNESPVVLCAVDWTGICNDAHVLMREKLAKAAHTTPERVAVHTVHQHNAPFIDLTAQKIVAQQQGLPGIFDVPWFETTVKRIADSVQAALTKTQPITHVATGEAKVDKVACNRRIIGPDGKVKGWRGSACKDPKLQAEPEGLIDPMLKTVSFWNGDKKLAALHYYATHPMSYYGDGLVTSDFAGLARERRAVEEPEVTHIYLTGCSGNIAAGKYNDGRKEMRAILAERLYAAMIAAERQPAREPTASFRLQSQPVLLPPRSTASEQELLKVIENMKATTADRNRAAMRLSYRLRARQNIPIQTTSLQLTDKTVLLHLPAESFVEYQLFAQQQRPGGFVATAAYGDDGPWYIPLAKAYEEGGYEPEHSWVDPDSEGMMKEAIRDLLKT